MIHQLSKDNVLSMQEIADIKGIRDPLFPLQDLFLVTLLAVLILLLVFALWRMSKRSSVKVKTIEKQIFDVHWTIEIASALEALKRIPLESDFMRLAYFEIAAIVRRMLEIKTKIGATEMTAFEIKRLVAPRFDAEVSARIVVFFDRCEQIQFAKGEGIEHWKSDLAWAYELFENLRQGYVAQNEKILPQGTNMMDSGGGSK